MRNRRVRHLNPGNSGADLAIDSRFIKGLNDGDSVSTWSDRTRNLNNLTQSGTNRPVYKKNIIGGNPVVRFSSANTQFMAAASSSIMDYEFNNPWTVIVIGSATNMATSNFFFAKELSNSTFAGWYSAVGGSSPTNTTVVILQNASGNFAEVAGSTILTNNIFYIMGFSNNGSSNAAGLNTYINSKLETQNNQHDNLSGSIKQGATFTIGSRNAGGVPMNGDISYLAIFPSLLPNSLRRRFDQSAAYSFRIKTQ